MIIYRATESPNIAGFIFCSNAHKQRKQLLVSQPFEPIPPGLTLFKACTGIFGASMSLRSLSASNFRSLDMLNLRAGTQKSIILLHKLPPTCSIYSGIQLNTKHIHMNQLLKPNDITVIIYVSRCFYELNLSYHSAFFLPLR